MELSKYIPHINAFFKIALDRKYFQCIMKYLSMLKY